MSETIEYCADTMSLRSQDVRFYDTIVNRVLKEKIRER